VLGKILMFQCVAVLFDIHFLTYHIHQTQSNLKSGMVLMPKMMESLDPEQKEQMQKQMAMQQDPSKVC